MDKDQVFTMTDPVVHKQREHILVIGVGGGGGNALNHIINSGLEGVEFIAANTDARALEMNKAPHKIILGEKLTKGLGAGADPQVGMDAAKESIDRIREYVTGADMIFVTAGMGGGTGTGAAPIIAEVAKEMGVLVVGVVTTPFSFEMKKRFTIAQDGIAKLKENVGALLVVENDRLLKLADEKTKSTDAYKMADDVLRFAVQGVTDLILKPGDINLDFADIRTVLKNAGSAIMGIGSGEGEKRAELAAKSAINSPLMSVPLTGAKGIIFNVTTGPDATLFELNTAAEIINATADEDALFLWGHVIDENMGGTMRITVIATGYTAEDVSAPQSSNVNNVNSINHTMSVASVRSSKNGAMPADEGGYQPLSDEDMFIGMPKTAYDTPAIYRKRQKRQPN